MEFDPPSLNTDGLEDEILLTVVEVDPQNQKSMSFGTYRVKYYYYGIN